MTPNQRQDQRKRVAQEAAGLLYTGQEKEYKQAKLRASRTLGFRVLPSNHEIAIELDCLAEDREGKARQERLLQMRREALRIMQTLKKYSPILVGSVWRGTAHQNSDIDIITCAQNPQEVSLVLQKNNYSITHAESQTVTEKGEKQETTHIYAKLPSDSKAEILVRSPRQMGSKTKCEIYGDIITGLNTQQLEKILRENPTQKFTPT